MVESYAEEEVDKSSDEGSLAPLPMPGLLRRILAAVTPWMPRTLITMALSTIHTCSISNAYCHFYPLISTCQPRA
ncbi:hypothetical protein JOQ06_004970 [Pogonophryne albipinna]|uniref:Uncharacterized protein n=1 Tax=Pogonophryne albipinna TaxID=1090488 RepID=A0AAD6AR27_9TELE|nr:hypothetical protein JOQ06_004970 [Pogonophryne albipinna]